MVGESPSGSPVLASKGAAALSVLQFDIPKSIWAPTHFLLQGPGAAQRGPCPCLVERAHLSTRAWAVQASCRHSPVPQELGVERLLSAKDTVSDSFAFFILVFLKYNELGIITASFKIEKTIPATDTPTKIN